MSDSKQEIEVYGNNHIIEEIQENKKRDLLSK